ncbi:MAG TPA: hydrogenase maturation nickel metallochaperone HypA [Steroidobacteraceae bacterium]|nr:hydrogenase maturation nickel metallochaperone HypA [Steroidobacteraceae bacterium]
MHELSICQALLDEVERVAREERAERVVTIVVRIGALAGVEPELLRSAFSIARAGTPAAAAELVLESTGVQIECPGCGAQSAVAVNALACPACGNWRTRVTAGEELILARVELTRTAGEEASHHV